MATDSDSALPTSPEEWLKSYGSLFRLARAILDDDALSEDAVQSAYLSALQSPAKSRTIGWWRRAVRNRAIDVARERGLWRTPQAARSRMLEAPSTDEVVAHIELQRTVLRAVANLDEKYREALFLRYFRGESPSRIARRLGVPVKTVKTRLTRGLERLRRSLASTCGSGPDENAWKSSLAVLAGNLGSAPIASTPLGITGVLVAMKKIFVAALLIVGTMIAWHWRASFMGSPSRPHAAEGVLPTVPDESVPAEETSELKPPLSASADAAEVRSPQFTPPVHETGSLRAHVVWPEGDDAQGVAVILQRGERADERTARREVSDQAGIVVFEGLEPGTVRAFVNRGAGRQGTQAEIIAGETSELRIDLGAGVQVRGYVRTGEGIAVPGASVWLTTRAPGWLSGRRVARSDAAGAFLLRHVPPDQSLGAIADGWAPSELVDLDLLDTAAPPVEVELVLHARGAGLTGTVLDFDGAPLEGARVIARSPHPERRNMHENGTIREMWGPRSATTDELGRFALSGLLPGEMRVSVLTRRHPTWEGSFELIGGETHDVVIQVAASASVSGTVLDIQGEPVVGGTVYAFGSQIDETFILMGQINGSRAAGTERATTGADGRFRLERLNPGVVYLYAQPKKDPRRAMGTVVLYAKTTLALAAGEEGRWDVRFDEGGVIHGTIEFRDGAPMTGVFVSAIDRETNERLALRSEDGSFRFAMLEADEYDISVQLNDPPPGARPLIAEGIEPNGPPLRIVSDLLSPDSIVTATVRVRFEDRAGRTTTEGGAGSLRVTLESKLGAGWHNGSNDGGTWTFEVPHADLVVPLAHMGDRVIAMGAEVEVTPGQDYDLGTLVTGPGAALVIRIARTAETEAFDAYAFVGPEGLRRIHRVPLGLRSEVRLEGLEPGATIVKVIGADFASVERTVVLASDEDTLFDLDLEPAVAVPFRIEWDYSQPIESVQILLNRASGERAETKRYYGLGLRTDALVGRFRVPVGAFTLEAVASDGRRARVGFSVDSLEGDPPGELRLDLHPE